MAGYRFWLQCGLSVVVASVIAQVGLAQSGGFPSPPAEHIPAPAVRYASATVASGSSAAPNGPTCKIYSLAELGDDPKLAKWVADTIPEMIQPASWKQAEVKLSYYAPSKILVVNHTPAVHAQVDEFLKNLKKSLPPQQAKTVRHDTAVMPAQFTVPDSIRATSPVQSGPSGYPVPFTAQTPKHLFHFIIRYEGEGIVDANVVKFAKALQDKIAPSTNSSSNSPTPQPISVDPIPVSGPFPYAETPNLTLPARAVLPPVVQPSAPAPKMLPADGGLQ